MKIEKKLTELQKLKGQLIYLKLEKAETLNEILKEYNKVLEKYNKDIKEIYDRIELLKKQSHLEIQVEIYYN